MGITSIGHVALRCRDVEETISFYGKLGIPLALRMSRADGTPGGPVFLKVAPGSLLELFPGGTEEPERTRTRVGYVHLALHVDDIHAFYANLRAHAIPTNGEPIQGRGGGWSFTLSDCNGLPLEIIQLGADSELAAAAR